MSEPLSHPLTVGDLPPDGARETIAPDDEARRRLAQHLNVPAVTALTAMVSVKRRSGNDDLFIVDGTIDVRLELVCSVTGDVFEDNLTIDLHRAFANPMAENDAPDPEFEPEDDDPPDTVIDGVINVGTLVSEELALNINPFPRRPGAHFDGPSDEDTDTAPSGPFAALAALREDRDT